MNTRNNYKRKKKARWNMYYWRWNQQCNKMFLKKLVEEISSRHTLAIDDLNTPKLNIGKPLMNSNVDKPAITVRHGDLKDAEAHSIYKKECPSCKIGVLPVRRNGKGNIYADDSCFYCGQSFIYSDLDEIETTNRTK